METVDGAASILSTHTSFRSDADQELKCLIAGDASSRLGQAARLSVLLVLHTRR